MDFKWQIFTVLAAEIGKPVVFNSHISYGNEEVKTLIYPTKGASYANHIFLLI